MSTVDTAEVLTKASRELKQMLEPNSVLDYLLSEGVLCQSEFDRCREPHCQSREDQCEELINILKQKGHSGYQHFCTILSRTQTHLKSLLDITAKSGGSGISDPCNPNATEEALVDMKKELRNIKDKMKSQEKRHEQQIKELTSRLISEGENRKDKDRKSSQSSETTNVKMTQETKKLTVVDEKKGNSPGRDQLLKWSGIMVLAVVCSACAVYMIHDSFMNRIGMNYGCRTELASIIAHASKQEHIINHTHSLLDEAIRKQAMCDIERSRIAESKPIIEQTDLDTKKENQRANDMIYTDLKKCQGTINRQRKKINKYAESYRQQINTCSIWDFPCPVCGKPLLLEWIFWTPLYWFLFLNVLMLPIVPALLITCNHCRKVTETNSNSSDDGLIVIIMYCFAMFVSGILAFILLDALWWFAIVFISFIFLNICLFCFGKCR